MCGFGFCCGRKDEEDEEVDQPSPEECSVPLHQAYHERWVSRWHRSTNKTKKIIRHVFSLKPGAPLGQEWNELSSQSHHQEVSSPECVAVPARMVQKLDPKELELGTFSGDSAYHFRQIYRASRLSSKERRGEAAPGSPPHYQHSGVLRNKPMVHYFNPTCCVEGQPTSPYFEDISATVPHRNQEVRHQGRGGSDVSALTSPTVTAGSAELNPLQQQQQQQHSRQSSVNEIFTIYEDSSVSTDSLDSSPRRAAGAAGAGGVGGGDACGKGPPQSDLDRILSSTSPVLKKGAYSGFIKEQSFSPTKFSV